MLPSFSCIPGERNSFFAIFYHQLVFTHSSMFPFTFYDVPLRFNCGNSLRTEWKLDFLERTVFLSKKFWILLTWDHLNFWLDIVQNIGTAGIWVENACESQERWWNIKGNVVPFCVVLKPRSVSFPFVLCMMSFVSKSPYPFEFWL